MKEQKLLTFTLSYLKNTFKNEMVNSSIISHIIKAYEEIHGKIIKQR